MNDRKDAFSDQGFRDVVRVLYLIILPLPTMQPFRIVHKMNGVSVQQVP
jgi:hypothetical protein